MRIIAGEFRGRRLLPPDSQVTRPITDRVKQSLFDVLTPLLPEARVFDLFSGTGSLGLESLSRGAAHATFFESDRSALNRLKQNIAALGVEPRSRVVPGDLFRWFEQAAPTANVDVAFLDCPYPFVRERPGDLQRLAGKLVGHLNPQGLIIFRHDANDALALPGLRAVDVRTYGQMTLELLQATSQPPSPKPPETSMSDPSSQTPSPCEPGR